MLFIFNNKFGRGGDDIRNVVLILEHGSGMQIILLVDLLGK
jgi:hypothetical protein